MIKLCRICKISKVNPIPATSETSVLQKYNQSSYCGPSSSTVAGTSVAGPSLPCSGECQHISNYSYMMFYSEKPTPYEHKTIHQRYIVHRLHCYLDFLTRIFRPVRVWSSGPYKLSLLPRLQTYLGVPHVVKKILRERIVQQRTGKSLETPCWIT